MSAVASTSSDPGPSSSTAIQSSVNTSLNIALHPLVIINISDHFTRMRSLADGKSAPRVIGCLLGTQSGRKVEIYNSFGLRYDIADDFIVIDPSFLKTKQEQYKKVFPTYDVLGWYSTGKEISSSDVNVHKQIMEVNESPLFLLMDPIIHPASKDLPVFIYESELHIVNETPTIVFVKAPFKIETLEAERIAVDHVARIIPVGEPGVSALTTHLSGMHSAVKMLNVRLKLLVQYLGSTQKGEVPLDHVFLRQVSSLCNRLPAVDTGKFRADFLNEYNDGLLIAYLASITKSTSAINELVGVCRVLDDKGGRRARGSMW
mmetsp:Transcript_24250/g.39838  ORF Transcript_24250/g.39838 Transcript_24250/m.39838 type:complete len:318 (-) Transcript_24250:82-1035(-)|eukprot:CAMPEP_0184644852 /NCGR_PEP_ID=MMETSP0308-20130426/1478_1 /TAXON_ID=38269 /ORGANISM="Gloeochaete witrockiana, Strain SAG 46.84" /LENGTH=317 /DNA_ID=CAMNT_0027073577 /DNA_START=393 /DNA_END=1346 /DNA_ORIENTATION=-